MCKYTICIYKVMINQIQNIDNLYRPALINREVYITYVRSEINNDISMHKKAVANKIFIDNFCCC